MKKHICDVCKLKEVTGSHGAIFNGHGVINTFYILDEAPNTPVHRQLTIKVRKSISDTTMETDEDICKTCLESMILEALGYHDDITKTLKDPK